MTPPSHLHSPSLAVDLSPAEIERLAGALALRLTEMAVSQPDSVQRADDIARLFLEELGATHVILFTRRAISRSTKSRSTADRLIIAASHPAGRNSYEDTLRIAAHRALEEGRLVEAFPTITADTTAPSDLHTIVLPLGMPATCVLALCWGANSRQADIWPQAVLIRLAPALTLATQSRRASLTARVPAKTATSPSPSPLTGERGPAKTAIPPSPSAGLLALMSHELRTPLNTINGFLEILLDGLAGPLSERQREFLAYAHTSTRRLTQLLEEMVLLSRSEQSRGLLYRVRTDLHGTLASACANHAEVASSRGVLLTCDIADALPIIWADEERLSQALGHLVGWALARTPTGGTVMLRASANAEGVAIAVEDGGPPLDHAALEQLFQPFRPPPATEVTGATTGLELAVAHRIITLHSGELRASTHSEGGIRLLCILPGPEDTTEPESAS